MKRNYEYDKKQLKILNRLCQMKILTGDKPEFRNFLLNLEKNITLGSQDVGELFRVAYIETTNIESRISLYGHKDDNLSIKISPKIGVETKQKLSEIVEKINIYFNKKSTIYSLDICDMIIDSDSFAKLAAHYSIKKVTFSNCYFEETSTLSNQNIENTTFKYCSLSSLNLISNFNSEEINLYRSKLRTKIIYPVKILAQKLIIEHTNFYQRDLFFKISFENLTNISIDKKVFGDSDLILLSQIAPKLKRASLSGTITDLKTLDKINLRSFYYFKPSKGDSAELQNFSGDHIDKRRVEINAEINLSLKNKSELRKKIIENLEIAKNSLYINEDAKVFYKNNKLFDLTEEYRQKLLAIVKEEIGIYINSFREEFDVNELLTRLEKYEDFEVSLTKYLLEQEKKHIKQINTNTKFKTTYTNAYNYGFLPIMEKIQKKYKWLVDKHQALFELEIKTIVNNYFYNVINSNLDLSIKKLILEEIKKFNPIILLKSGISKPELSKLTSPLYSINIDRVIENLFYEYCISLQVRRKCISYIADGIEEELDELIKDFKNNKKHNYELLDIMIIANIKSLISFIYGGEGFGNYSLFEKLKNIETTNNLKQLILEEKVSKEELREIINKSYVQGEKGVFVPNGSLKLDGELIVKPFISFHEFNEQRKKEDTSYLLNKYLKTPTEKNSEGQVVARYPYNLNIVIDYNEVEYILTAKSDLTKDERMKEVISKYPLFNEADYAIFISSKYRGLDYLYKTGIYLLKFLGDKCLYLTKEDYGKIKNEILKKHYEISNDCDDLIHPKIYFEIYKYITGKYPEFIERVLDYGIGEKDPIESQIIQIYQSHLKYLDEFIQQGANNPEKEKILKK